MAPSNVRPFPSAIGAYRVLAQIGAGGMGVVYRARHRSEVVAERQGGDVAIKVMHPHLAAVPDFRERFEREASLALKLDHPGIIGALDLVVDAGVLALVMEFVEGRSLAHILESETGPVPWSRAGPLFRLILDAVAYAHSEGVVHRDLKPENVLVTRDGRPLILDFGIAKELGSTATATGTGMGTPEFMAPEQHTDARSVDHRADIYALGMTLYVVLAGRTPWGPGVDALGLLHLKLQGELLPPTAWYPAIPSWVSDAVMWALQKDPQARYPSVQAFGEALGLVLDRRTGPPAPPRSVPPSRSRRTAPAPPPPAPDGATVVRGPSLLRSRGLPLIALGALLALIAVVGLRVMGPRLADGKACEEARGAYRVQAWEIYLAHFPQGSCAPEAQRATAPILVGPEEEIETIQEAVQLAVEHQEVSVSPGVYRENVVIDKAVKISAAGRGEVIVQPDKGVAIEIRAASPHLVGLTLRSGGQDVAALVVRGGSPIIQGCDVSSTRVFDGRPLWLDDDETAAAQLEEFLKGQYDGKLSDARDRDGDGVYDVLELRLGTDPEDPAAWPDVYAQLSGSVADRPASPNLGLFVPPEGVRGRYVGSHLLLHEEGRNSPDPDLCIGPPASRSGVGSALLADQAALVEALVLRHSGSDGKLSDLKLTPDGYFTIAHTFPDADRTSLAAGHYQLVDGYLLLSYVGNSLCHQLFVADIDEVACLPTAGSDGWASPLASEQVEALLLHGEDTFTGQPMEFRFENPGAVRSFEQPCNGVSERREGATGATKLGPGPGAGCN